MLNKLQGKGRITYLEAMKGRVGCQMVVFRRRYSLRTPPFIETVWQTSLFRSVNQLQLFLWSSFSSFLFHCRNSWDIIRPFFCIIRLCPGTSCIYLNIDFANLDWQTVRLGQMVGSGLSVADGGSLLAMRDSLVSGWARFLVMGVPRWPLAVLE